MIRSRSRLAVWVVLLLHIAVPAQQIADKDSPPEKPNQKKALDLLDTVALRLPDLKSPDNRIVLSALVAELLWSKDEKRARTLFENAMKEISTLATGIDFSDSQVYGYLAWVNQLRTDTLARIARCDPQLALSLLRSSRITTGMPNDNMAERNLEFYLARIIALKDPEQGARVARESLSRGLSYDLLSLLSDLQQKNQPAAQSLYEAMVDRIKEEDLARSPEAAHIACNLVNSFTPPQASETAFRRLLDAVAGAALSSNPEDPQTASQAQTFQGNLSSLNVWFEKFLPNRVDQLKQWSQRFSRTLDPGSQMYNEINEVTQNGTVDDLLSLAAKYPPEMRASIYQQAAWKALNAGDSTRARQIATDNMADPVQRRQMLEQIENTNVWKAINDNKMAEARGLLTKLSSVEQRFQTLMHIARTAASKEDKKTALECLNEARSLLASSPRNRQRLSWELQLAVSYAEFDIDRSFALVDGVMNKLNELVAAAVVMDGFENTYLRNGEWMMNGPNGVGGIVGELRRTLAQLGNREFDRAEAAAEKLERPEIRIMAQVEIAQAVLANENGNLMSKRHTRWRE